MIRPLKIVSINQVVTTPILSSRFSREVAEDHLPFFGGQSSLTVSDSRAPLLPAAGPTITLPGLRERWQLYDEQYRAQLRISRFWVAELQNAVVYPPFGIVRVGDQIIRETIRNGSMLKTIFPDADPDEFTAALQSPDTPLLAAAPQAARRAAGATFLLGFGVFENYFNWTLRYASRVSLYQAMPGMDHLLAPAPKKAYVADTLEFMGVRQEAVIHLDAPVECEQLTIVSPVALGRYEISPLICHTLREHPRVTNLWRGRRRRLYIPRHNVKMRVVVNEQALEAVLKRMGFEVFDNSKHSVLEQVRAFRDADIVVAPHGAGLSNIVYCDSGTSVLEIVPEGYDQGVTSYRSLADLFELRYMQLFAREVAPDRKGNPCNANIEVDISELTQTIRDLIA